MADIYKSILDWSVTRTLWERDALRRIVFGDIRSEDIAELCAMAKAEAGIRTSSPRRAVPLAAEHLNHARTAANVVVLDAMHSVKHANALAPGQTLTFTATGLTVIYGENGSGKTGYARVLRRACRARRATDILGDIAGGWTSPAEASFTVRRGKDPARDVRWVQGASSPDELATFCVFDRECERSFVDEEGETAFLPDGLDVFHELASVVAKVRESLVDEQRRALPGDGSLDDVRREVSAPPEVVAFLKSIGAGEPVDVYERLLAAVDTFCASAEETKRCEELDFRLAEIKVNDPMKTAAALRRLANSVEGGVRAWRAAADTLSDQAALKLRAVVDRAREAQKALALVTSDAPADVPGLGTETWRALYRAAEAYAVEHVHPGVEFPDTRDSASCPLCLQPLDATARTRFQRFQSYMTRAAERAAGEAARAAADAKKLVLDLEPAALDDHSMAALTSHNPAAAAAALGLAAAVAARHQAVTAALENSMWPLMSAIDPRQVETLQQAITSLRKDADAVEKLADPAARAALQAERDALAGRIEIGKRKQRITETLTRLRDAARLGACHAKMNTNAITAKGRAIAADVLTDELVKAFNREMKELGAAERISVTVGHRADHGRSLYSLALTGAPRGRWNRSHVLSEGEQRVVALAYFLAETQLAPSPVGIIIDDPVSSLDHRWCGPIAKRLTELARDRQVIIFTHSISFYTQLERCATDARVPFHVQFLVRRAGVPGHCDAMASPWEKLSVADRLGPLAAELGVLRTLYDENPDGRPYRDAANGFVDRLRAAWERAVEEIILNKVVERFDDAVKTQSLRGVVCDDDTFRAVNEGMSRLSADTQAHDKAAAHVGTVRSPDAFAIDLKALESFASEHKKKRKEVNARREMLLTPPAASLAPMGEPADLSKSRAPPSTRKPIH